MLQTCPRSLIRQRLIPMVRGKITGTGLAKICARLNVPCPPRRYWAKKATPTIPHATATKETKESVTSPWKWLLCRSASNDLLGRLFHTRHPYREDHAGDGEADDCSDERNTYSGSPICCVSFVDPSLRLIGGVRKVVPKVIPILGQHHRAKHHNCA